MLRVILMAGWLLALAACAHRGPPPPAIALPPLHLTPASLGTELSLQQRLHFRMGQQQRTLDALLEADAQEVRLAVQAMGQSGVRLQWDGQRLQQQRAAWLPPMVRAERVLDDLQFACWPLTAVQAALPPGWRAEDDGQQRRLLHGDTPWLILERTAPGKLQLRNLAEGYALDIETAGSTP